MRRVGSYSDLLRNPRWQRKRLEVMQRADFKCERCGDGTVTLNVHHTYYERGRKPWEYPNESLECLCEPCHEKEHEPPPTPIDPLSIEALDPRERFLFELLIIHRDLKTRAVNALPELPTELGRRVLAVLDGQANPFELLPLLKQLRERAEAKEPKALASPEHRLHTIVTALHHEEREREIAKRIEAAGGMSQSEEIEMLKEIASRKLEQMGLPPKEPRA